MALYVKQETEKNEFKQRIASELREKIERTSLEGDKESKAYDLDSSAYLEGTKQTTGLAFVWLLLWIAILLAIGYFIWFSK